MLICHHEYQWRVYFAIKGSSVNEISISTCTFSSLALLCFPEISGMHNYNWRVSKGLEIADKGMTVSYIPGSFHDIIISFEAPHHDVTVVF